ncbi:DNA photolyase family protein [Bacteriovoracaceae bacterium]|nr:DNA photolyase family protein [Bacteriovoracaceae bacterium]
MEKKQSYNIFWFRRDLRLKDNVGLYHALNSNTPVILIFIFDKTILKKLSEKDDPRVNFIYQTLQDMKSYLHEKNRDLHLFYGNPDEIFIQLTKSYFIKKVYSNEDYEPYAIKRDQKIQSILLKKEIEFEQFKDQCIFAKNDILKKDGNPYTVYTPYKRKWLENITEEHLVNFPSEKHLSKVASLSDKNFLKLSDMGFKGDINHEQPKNIKKKIIINYNQARDYPAKEGTSLMSTNLRFGLVSPRKCVQIGQNLNDTWLSELIWREFFMQILFHFPYSINKCFKEKYEKIEWVNDKKEFKKWCEGKTGYALVDAGMRELNQTGFMHNRVRMVVASFLIKHLLIDWRWGEKYFSQKLMDFELASNVGNWQWVAGTGCDAAPYFRIFNPETQLKKFDPDLTYVKKWVPEYGTDEYPAKMIDHSFAYHRALEAYKKVNLK